MRLRDTASSLGRAFALESELAKFLKLIELKEGRAGVMSRGPLLKGPVPGGFRDVVTLPANKPGAESPLKLRRIGICF